MAFRHGRFTVVTLNAVDLSGFIKTSDYNRAADSHDVTHYGNDSKVYQGGLLDGTLSMSGTYSDDVAGPRATIEPLLGTNTALIRQQEGVGSGLPQQSVDVLVENYEESNPVDGMIEWSSDLQFSSDVNLTPQV